MRPSTVLSLSAPLLPTTPFRPRPLPDLPGCLAEAKVGMWLGVPRSYGTYEELLFDDDVQAVYIPLPIALHAEWTIRALRAGKHVLCEKPLAVTAADAAEAAGRLCIEGLMWRHHPQTALARSLLADGAIGRLTYVRAALTDSAAGAATVEAVRRSAATGSPVTLS